MSHIPLRRLGIAATSAVLLAILAASTTAAHVLKDFGSYSVALGWVTEPTYVGQVNGVQVVIKDKQGKAITDLADGDLKVVVSVGGRTSAALSLDTKFDPDTGLGVPGDYEASLIPTVPGDYTFHLTGSIHGQAVDETASSSGSTFNSAVESTAIQFPTKLPSLTEITTRLDRIATRLSASPSPAAALASPALNDATAGLADAVVAAQAAASQAQQAASTSLVVGIIVGALGIVLGGTALALTRRDRGRS